MSAPEILTFGCRLNAFESEIMRDHAAAAGLERAVIFNTATFEGKLVFTFNYSEYHVTGEEAVNVANRAMQNLYRMAGLEAPERFVELG